LAGWSIECFGCEHENEENACYFNKIVSHVPYFRMSTIVFKRDITILLGSDFRHIALNGSGHIGAEKNARQQVTEEGHDE
jgi:hypothetical protein